MTYDCVILVGGVAEHMKFSFVYIMTNRPFGTLYIGVTSNLVLRVSQHKQALGSQFCKLYNLDKLVWYEQHEDITIAIQRETSLKRWLRLWKLQMISEFNPDWRDLFDDLLPKPTPSFSGEDPRTF